MEINFHSCTIPELWKFVASNLAKNGVDVVLVGGAVVSIYTDGAYESGDLDFVINDFSRKKLDSTLFDLGFKKEGRFYKHPECKHLFIEFASFPVSIGDDTDITPEMVNIEGTVIKIFSPTDCIRDRLASYIHFKTKDCLEQAIMVAQKHPFNLKKIKDWCKKENGDKAFNDFKVL